MKKISIRFVLTPILFWCAIYGIYLLTGSYPLVSNGHASGPTMVTLIFSSLGIGIALIAYLVLERKKNNIRPNYILIPLFLILSVTSIIGIWLSSSYYSWSDVRTTSVYISNEMKITYTIETLLIFLGLYAVIAVFLKHKTQNRHIYWLLATLVIAICVLCGASIFTDFEIYKEILTSNKMPINGVKGFTSNSNIFGLACFIGIVSCIILNAFKKKWFRYVLIPIFYLFGAFSLCATSQFIGIIVILIYFIIESIFLIKSKNKAKYFLFTSLYILIIGFGVVFIISLNNDLGFMSHISKTAMSFISDNDFITFTGRKLIWDNALKQSLEDPYHFVCGYGFRIGTLISSQRYFSICNHLYFDQYLPLHSGFMEVLLSNGVIGLGVYILAIFYVFYCLFKIRKYKGYRYSLEFAMLLCAIIVYSCFESFNLFDLTSTGIMLSFVSLFPIQSRYQMKHQYIEEEIMNYPRWEKKIPRLTLEKTVAQVLTIILVVLASLFVNNNIYYDNAAFNLLITGIVLVFICLLFLPYLISNFYLAGTRKLSIFRFTLLTALMVLTVGGLYYGYLCTNNQLLFMILIPSSVFVLLLLLCLFYLPVFNQYTKSYLSSLLKGIFKANNFYIIVLAILIILPVLILQINHVVSDVEMLSIVFMSIMILLLSLLVSPFKENKEIVEELNKEGLYLHKRGIIYGQNRKD